MLHGQVPWRGVSRLARDPLVVGSALSAWMSLLGVTPTELGAGAGDDVEAEAAAAFGPFVGLLGQDSADEADGGVAAGEREHVGPRAVRSRKNPNHPGAVLGGGDCRPRIPRCPSPFTPVATSAWVAAPRRHGDHPLGGLARAQSRADGCAQAEATCARSLAGGGRVVAVSVPGPLGGVRAPARAMAGRWAGGAKWWRRSRPP
jgi:hypothetical protein